MGARVCVASPCPLPTSPQDPAARMGVPARVHCTPCACVCEGWGSVHALVRGCSGAGPGSWCACFGPPPRSPARPGPAAGSAMRWVWSRSHSWLGTAAVAALYPLLLLPFAGAQVPSGAAAFPTPLLLQLQRGVLARARRSPCGEDGEEQMA